MNGTTYISNVVLYDTKHHTLYAKEISRYILYMFIVHKNAYVSILSHF